MNELPLGRVKEIVCLDFNEAQTKAGQEAANTAGFPLPVIIFRQGKRVNLSGALPFSFVATRLITRSALKRATISATADTMNRPEDPAHTENIAKYISGNRKGQYILPPLTLNIQQEARLYTAETESMIKTAFLVIPATAKLAITDGQHRRTGIAKAIESLSHEESQELEGDGIGVMITCETNIDQIHQDFADCSKTKPLPPSQLAVYDRRNPANRLVIELENRCRLFRGKIDATSKTLGKKSTSLFLANQVRQLVKVLLTGSWQMSDPDFETHARKLLEQEPSSFERQVSQFCDYIDTLTDVIPVWKQIASLDVGVEGSQIPVLRQKGYICLGVTGLVILGHIGHELFRQKESNWKHHAERLGRVPWEKQSQIWQGNIVSDGRILSQQKLVRDATQKVRDFIQWRPRIGPDYAEANPESVEITA